MKISAILLKPLDGAAVGTAAEFEKDDFDRLKGMRAVRAADDSDPEPSNGDDDAARMLAALRDPIGGPKIIGEIKASFEDLRISRETALADLRAAGDKLAAVEQERDKALARIEELTKQIAAAPSAAAEASKATPTLPPSAPATKAAPKLASKTA